MIDLRRVFEDPLEDRVSQGRVDRLVKEVSREQTESLVNKVDKVQMDYLDQSVLPETRV